MSDVEIFRFRKKNGKAQFADRAPNAWGFHMHIWRSLENKYGLPETSLLDDRLPVWELFGSDRMSAEDQVVLGATFDRFIVKQENLPRLISALERFQDAYRHSTIADLIEVLKREAGNPDTRAVGFNMSANVGYWEVGPNRRAYNIRKDSVHKELFERLSEKGVQV